MKSKALKNPWHKLSWFYLIGFLLILALPLLNFPPWFSPSDWGKTFVFRIVLVVLIFLFLYQFLTTKEWSSFRFLGRAKIGFYLLLALLGIYLLATLFSLDRNFSLWGDPHRSGGFVNFAFYIFFTLLVFLILKKSDWQKVWDFSILIGILVCLVAFFQWQGWLKEFLIPFETRPPSTIGGPIFLAIYLLLLSFLVLSFGLKTKNLLKKLFYFLSFFSFVFVAIFITQTRAVMIGFFVGFFYFIFFYPFKKFFFSLALKIIALIFTIFLVSGIYYLNTQPKLPTLIQENRVFRQIASRLSIKAGLTDPRISGWKVAWEALKARPILGYGPENFAVGFDRYYDPSLPGIEKMPGNEAASWWDRAHNFVFDIGITAGVLALIIYLSLFGILFWQLQKLKGISSTNNEDKVPPPLISHSLQATFIAYLMANFFSFDTFSTYLISFLLIGYSLFLLKESSPSANMAMPPSPTRKSLNLKKWEKYKMPFLLILALTIIWFIWEFNLKPFSINTQINIVKVLVNQGNCELALNRLNEFLKKKSVIDAYLRKKYIEFLLECQAKKLKLSFDLEKKGQELAKEVVEIQPYCTRSWINLVAFTLDLLKQEKDPEIAKKLKNEAYYALERVYQLSPKRQEVFVAKITADLLTNQYQQAKERAEECINLNSRLAECHWLKGLSEIFLGNLEEGEKSLKRAEELGYPQNSQKALEQLAQAYFHQKNYKKLLEIFQKLIQINPANLHYRISLSVCYKELGKTEEAKKEALKILELWPELKDKVDEFLKTLP